MRPGILLRIFLALGLLTLPFMASAQGILTVRSALDFEDSMPALKASIEAHGYTVSHVQRCDSGLEGSGYETDRYRILFFGKIDEVRNLSAEYPGLIPFLPLKIALFAEGDNSIVAAMNPVALGEFYPDEKLRSQFRRWESDIRSILAEIQYRDEAAAAAVPAE